jgi:chromosome segregation ATPase
MTNEDTERVEELEAAVEELESRNDELLEEVQAVRAEYAEALSGDSPFDEDELIDKFTVEELREKYDETEEARLAGAGPAPEAGDAGEAELSNPDEEVEQRIEELEAQAENYEAMGWDAALAETETKIEELRN